MKLVSRLMITLSVLAPSLSFADQIWDHSFTTNAKLEVIYQQSQGNCPRDILIETNASNEIHMQAHGEYFVTMDAYNIMDGRERSINGQSTSFEMNNGKLEMTAVRAVSGWGKSGFSSTKTKMEISADKNGGTYTAELVGYRKESLVGFYKQEQSSTCKYKNTLVP